MSIDPDRQLAHSPQCMNYFSRLISAMMIGLELSGFYKATVP